MFLLPQTWGGKLGTEPCKMTETCTIIISCTLALWLADFRGLFRAQSHAWLKVSPVQTITKCTKWQWENRRC